MAQHVLRLSAAAAAVHICSRHAGNYARLHPAHRHVCQLRPCPERDVSARGRYPALRLAIGAKWHLYWLRRITIRRERQMLRTDMPRSQYRYGARGIFPVPRLWLPSCHSYFDRPLRTQGQVADGIGRNVLAGKQVKCHALGKCSK